MWYRNTYLAVRCLACSRILILYLFQLYWVQYLSRQFWTPSQRANLPQKHHDPYIWGPWRIWRFCEGFQFYWLGQLELHWRDNLKYIKMSIQDTHKMTLQEWVSQGASDDVAAKNRTPPGDLPSTANFLAQTAANLTCWNNVDISDSSSYSAAINDFGGFSKVASKRDSHHGYGLSSVRLRHDISHVGS